MINTPEQFFYQEQGYLLIENLFSSQEVDHALLAIEEIMQGDNPETISEMEPINSQVPRRIWGATYRHSLFEHMMQDKKLLDVVEMLIGPNIIFQYSRINMKSPKIGSPVEWHQDFAYNPHTNTDLVTCLIYLDDADTENGCLQLMPKSHKAGMYDHYVGNFFRGKILEDKLPRLPSMYIEAPKGSVIFIHCLTLHKSEANESSKPRRAFLPSYRSADAYPIYLGRHTSDHEPKTKLVRGERSNYARLESGNFLMPHAEKVFNSLYEIQEGSHLTKSERSATGYFGKTP